MRHSMAAAAPASRRPGRSRAARRRRCGAARARGRCPSPAPSRDARPAAGCSSRGSRSCRSASTRNSTVPAFTYPAGAASRHAASPMRARSAGVHDGRGALLDELLVAALDRALALAEVHDRRRARRRAPAPRCGAALDVALEVDGAVAERRAASRARQPQRGRQLALARARGACPCRRLPSPP